MSFFCYLLVLATCCVTVKGSHTQTSGDIIRLEVCEWQAANFTASSTGPEAKVNKLRLTFHGKSNNSATKPVASVIYGRLLPDPDYTTRVRRLPNDTGISVLSARKKDEGFYSLSEDIQLNGSLSQTVSLTIYLKVKDLVQPQIAVEEVWWNAKSEQWLLPLSCNIFTSDLSQLPLHTARWTDPNNKVVNSTRYKEGKFYLDLPQPVTGGLYLCSTPPRTDADVCLGHNLHGQTKHLAVGVRVDEVSARLKVLEARQWHRKSKDDQVDVNIVNLNVTVEDLGHKQVALDTSYNTLFTRLTESEANLTDLRQRDNSIEETLEKLNVTVEMTDLRQRDNSIEETLEELNVTVEDLEQKQVVLDTNYNTLLSRLTKSETNLTDLRQRNIFMEKNLGALSADLTVNVTQIVNRSHNVHLSLEAKIARLDQTVLNTTAATNGKIDLLQQIEELLLMSNKRLQQDLTQLINTASSQQHRITDLQEQVSVLNSQFVLMKKENNEFGNRLASLQDHQKADDRKTAALETKLMDLAVKSNRSVGFQADFGLLFKSVTLSTDSPTVFDRVVFNEGQGYNKATGVFTAPYSGLYTFTLEISSGLHNEVTIVQIYLEGKDVTLAIAKVFGEISVRNDQDSCTAVTRLLKGQQVSVRLYLGNPSIWGSRLTSFTGLLIHSDE